MALEHTLQQLYDSEIHVEISWLWDGGIDVYLGVSSSAGATPQDRIGTVRTVAEVEPLLIAAACRQFPRSQFARAWALGTEEEGKMNETGVGVPPTDLEKFVALYATFGIHCRVIPRAHLGSLEKKFGCWDGHESGSVILLGSRFALDSIAADHLTTGACLDGYGGFFTAILFDANGQFIGQGFWE